MPDGKTFTIKGVAKRPQGCGLIVNRPGTSQLQIGALGTPADFQKALFRQFFAN